MKTQIIQLEPHDDHISIRDKMNWSKTPRILLILPRRRRFNLNTLDLKLLKRHAKNLGADLGLVTKSSKIIRAANELNISVFSSNLSAQREAWHPSKSVKYKKSTRPRNLRKRQKEFQPTQAKWRTHLATRSFFFILGILAFFSVIFAFVPRATITLKPEKRVQSLIIPVRANANISEVFLSGSIPAYQQKVVLAESSSRKASGQVATPVEVAYGSVIFRNLTDLPVTIPTGTVIRSITDEEIRFETLDDAPIAGGVDAEVEVRIRALVFGERGNLDPNLIQAIEGGLGLWLAATNVNPTTDGRDDIVSTPTQRDREKLYDQTIEAIYKKAEENFLAKSDGDLLFPNSAKNAEIIEEIYDPPEGESGDDISLKLRVSFEISYAKEEDLRYLAQSALLASLPQGFAPVPNSLHYKAISDFENNAIDITSWQMRVEQDLLPLFSASQIAKLTQGRSIENAVENLEENLALAEAPQIEVSPSWWKRIPIAPFRINILVE